MQRSYKRASKCQTAAAHSTLADISLLRAYISPFQFEYKAPLLLWGKGRNHIRVPFPMPQCETLKNRMRWKYETALSIHPKIFGNGIIFNPTSPKNRSRTRQLSEKGNFSDFFSFSCGKNMSFTPPPPTEPNFLLRSSPEGKSFEASIHQNVKFNNFPKKRQKVQGCVSFYVLVFRTNLWETTF